MVSSVLHIIKSIVTIRFEMKLYFKKPKNKSWHCNWLILNDNEKDADIIRFFIYIQIILPLGIIFREQRHCRSSNINLHRTRVTQCHWVKCITWLLSKLFRHGLDNNSTIVFFRKWKLTRFAFDCRLNFVYSTFNNSTKSV
jgi:hypothetical protein